ncbi:MAG: glycosyltransferase [Gemmatimonadaceae bacterium]
MRTPRISIVVPVYNAERYLDDTIRSVLAQSFREWELLLVDDGSTDGSTAIARRCAAADPARVRCLEHPGHANRGQFASRVLGARHARADVLALLDADDLWNPNYLEDHLRLWHAAAPHGVGVSYGPALYWFSGEGAGSRDYVQPMPPGAPRVYRPAELLESFFDTRFANTPCPACALIRPEVFAELGQFEEMAHRSWFEDQILWWYVAARWPVAVHCDVWVRYRQHETSFNRAAARTRPEQSELSFLRLVSNDLSHVSPGHALLTTGKLTRRIRELAARQSLTGRSRQVLERHLPLGVLPAASGSYRAASRVLGHAVELLRRVVPGPVKRPIRRALQLVKLSRTRARLAVGVQPLSYRWGTDRGFAIHRYYLNQFLQAFRADIRGECLEFQDATYAPKYGGSAITRMDVLHLDASNPAATVVADLTKPNDIATDRFDCIICTHVLHLIPELDRAVSEMHRILKPGGVLLAAVPHVSMCDPNEHELWRFTPEGLAVLLSKAFSAEHVVVRAYGNALTAGGELHGLVADEFRPSELEYHDPRFAVEVCARAVKGSDPQAGR